MYVVKIIFGIIVLVMYDWIVYLIDVELYQMDWYWENGYYCIVVVYLYYIVGYSLFVYVVLQFDWEFFYFFYWVSELVYFCELGFKFDYCNFDMGQFNSKVICKVIDQIVKKYCDCYLQLCLQVSIIFFDNLLDFFRIFFLMICNLDLM